MPAFWTEPYRRHFQHYFGKPFDVQVYHSGDAALKLATHDWAREGFRVYASMGLADRLIESDAKAFGEVLLFSDVPDKEVPAVFVNALFFILQQAIPLGAPFAIGFGGTQPAFVNRYGKSALYFTRPAGSDEDFAEVEDGDEVGRVYQTYFITPEEDDFLDKEGPKSFEEKFWKQFGEESSEEVRRELGIDTTKADVLQSRLHELWQQSSKALSIRRPSCV